MVKAVIFDVDGTLVDSVAIHAKAWQEAFGEFGHQLTVDALRGQIGKGGDQLIPAFLSQEEVDAKSDALDARRAAILKDKYLSQIHGFPKVRELFLHLRERGIAPILASSAKGDELDFYKRRAGIDDLVETETSSDDAERSKPHPDIFEAAIVRAEGNGIAAAEMIVVGDTPYDAEAASKAGLRTIGLLCGGFSREGLERAGCIAIYRDPADLLENYARSPLAWRSAGDA